MCIQVTKSMGIRFLKGREGGYLQIPVETDAPVTGTMMLGAQEGENLGVDCGQISLQRILITNGKRFSIVSKSHGARCKTKYNQMEITAGCFEQMTFPALLTKRRQTVSCCIAKGSQHLHQRCSSTHILLNCNLQYQRSK